MLNKIRVSTRFLFQIGVWALMLFLVAGLLLFARMNMKYYYFNLFDSLTKNQITAARIKNAVLSISDKLETYIATTDPKLRKQLASAITAMDKELDDLILNEFTGKKQSDISGFFQMQLDSWRRIRSQIRLLSDQGKKNEAMELFNSNGKRICERLTTAMETLASHNNDLVNQSREFIRTHFYKLGYGTLTGIIAIILINLVLMFFTYRSIVNPLKRISHVAKKVLAGDYTSRVKVDGKNEMYDLARVINQMLDKIQEHENGLVNTIKNCDKANKELKAKNAEMEDFVKIISHDIKSPLSTIEMFGEVLKRDLIKQPNRVPDDIDRIRNNTHRLRNLLDDLTEYSLIGLNDDKNITVNIKELISDVLESLCKNNLEKKAHFVEREQNIFEVVFAMAPDSRTKIYLADNIPDLYADYMQVSQIFLNIIGNAVKYKSDKPLEIHINGYREGGFSHISVHDNGIGIDPRYKDKIFDMCYRLVPRDKVDGTGVGLAIVKKIVERFGGRVWVESDGEGKGSTFHILLPASA